MSQTCMKSNLQGQDLSEIIGGNDTKLAPTENIERLKNQRINDGKFMLEIKITVENEMLKHIVQATTPREAWDIPGRSLFEEK